MTSWKSACADYKDLIWFPARTDWANVQWMHTGPASKAALLRPTVAPRHKTCHAHSVGWLAEILY